MKTEQEQIEKMARSMCGYCSTDGKCAVSKNGREPDICANIDTQHCLYKEYAERLIESGYGKVSEYEAEIEILKIQNKNLGIAFDRLEAENERLTERLKQILLSIDTVKEMNAMCNIDEQRKQAVKQAQIDVLNKAKKRLDNAPNGWAYTTYIDELIKEVENDK